MKNIEDLISKISKTVSMSKLDKERIRNVLISNFDDASIQTQRQIPSPFFSQWLMFFHRHAMSSVVVAILFLTGTTSVLAEKALPGSPLYFLKTGVNEEVRGWFSVSDYEKAEWQVELAERRLNEAEIISQKPNISSKIREEHKRAVDLQVLTANENAESLEKKDEDLSQATFLANEEPAASEGLSKKSSEFKGDMSQPSVEAGLVLKKADFVATSSPEEMNKTRQSYREKITSLHKELTDLRKEIKSDPKSLRFEARLLFAQKLFLESLSDDISDEESEEKSRIINEIIVDTESYIGNVREIFNSEIEDSVFEENQFNGDDSDKDRSDESKDIDSDKEEDIKERVFED